MSLNPVSIRGDAPVREGVALLVDRGFGAAPVIDAAGRPIGVISRTDLLVHEREQVRHAPLGNDTDLELPSKSCQEGFSVEVVDPTTIEEVMTPVVFAVTPETSAREVIDRMLELKVHQLFVVDENEVLIGVISPLDVLRHI
jgi:CBS domain-containing protein